MKRFIVFILILILPVPQFARQIYCYKSNSRSKSNKSFFANDSGPKQTIIGITSSLGSSGGGSRVVYDPTYSDQTVESKNRSSYSFGIFINIFEGVIIELSRNIYEIQHTWYDDFGSIEYTIPVTTTGLTVGYRLSWPGFYHVNRTAGHYPFIMAGCGAHWCTSKPEPEVEMELNEDASELDTDKYYAHRLNKDMEQLQGSLTWVVGNELVLSRNFSIAFGLRVTSYHCLYINNDAEKILDVIPEGEEKNQDLGGFSEIVPITVHLFASASVMF